MQVAALWALAVVFSDSVAPLDFNATSCSWTWLMQGDERVQRKITGMNVLSPKLIHFIAKTTCLAVKIAAKLQEVPPRGFSRVGVLC